MCERGPRRREEHGRHQLTRCDLADDPLAQFGLWIAEAIQAGLRVAQLATWASPQSRPLASLDELVRLHADARRYPGEVPRPPHRGGFRLVPDRIEFWQGGPQRLHDRVSFVRSGPGEFWGVRRLAP